MQEETTTKHELIKQQEAFDTAISDYRKELATLKKNGDDLFEKQLSYISAGAIGISMLVIEKLFKDIAITVWKPLIITSWIGFGSALFINLVSHPIASYLHNKSIRDIDLNKYNYKTVSARNFKIELVNYISIFCLFVGICCFVIYTSKNIYTMSNPITNNPDSTRSQSSSAPPPHPAPETAVTPTPPPVLPTSPKKP